MYVHIVSEHVVVYVKLRNSEVSKWKTRLLMIFKLMRAKCFVD